ncbi:MAG TPA: UDP-N-acetylglucosamine 2-epimerase (non-hydrolyzing) [Candidatus Sulfotelmatobacter sp.]|nr:UDP-N-acetylglucosamine 2-epimerase (non-hydrolyzing) [Candidatus Sulfotelmatobacter sp.]
MHILHVVGARPNFMKAAPVLRALAAHSDIRQTLVHTGQHYDAAMSDVFFRQLDIPEPDRNLEVGSGTHAQQTAAIMAAFEPVLLDLRPDLVLVYGDVNSTLAAALVCSKLGVRVGHVEAGLRSRDRSMPEEINRLLTDQLSDLLFTPSADADENLAHEGIDKSKIHLVGNVMIDTLVRLLPRADGRLPTNISKPYALVTLHRPSNVDDLHWLRDLLSTLSDLSQQLSIIFPVHPRTRQRLDELGFMSTNSRLLLLDPLPYIQFIGLQREAALVITDSGGIQEETTFLGVPCLTVRKNTERPITVSMGTNQVVGRDLRKLRTVAEETLQKVPAGRKTRPHVPMWDGHTAERIAEILVRGPISGAK